jgi:hypothetical protein
MVFHLGEVEASLKRRATKAENRVNYQKLQSHPPDLNR